MKKANLDFRIQVNFLREGNKFIAYTPALDLSTSGKTYKEAKERFAEAVSIFFEEIMEKGTLEDVLLDLGWKRTKASWSPPVPISQEYQTVRLAQ